MEQFREVVLGAACRRVDAHRGLDTAEELEPKLLLLMNCQMFVQVLTVLALPSLVPHLYIFSCGQSASPVSERG